MKWMWRTIVLSKTTLLKRRPGEVEISKTVSLPSQSPKASRFRPDQSAKLEAECYGPVSIFKAVIPAGHWI
jgi:hypothetical protein